MSDRHTFMARRLASGLLLAALVLTVWSTSGCVSHPQKTGSVSASTSVSSATGGGLDLALGQLLAHVKSLGYGVGSVSIKRGELGIEVFPQTAGSYDLYEALAQQVQSLAGKYKDQLKVDLLHVRVASHNPSGPSRDLYDRYFQLSVAHGFPGHSADIRLDLGPLSSLKMGELWIRVAQAGGFLADAATAERVELDYLSPSNMLSGLMIIAHTADDRTVTLGWAISGDAADQAVVVTGQVMKGAVRNSNPDHVSAILAAVDEVGAARMIALVPSSVAEGGHYALSPQLHYGTVTGMPTPMGSATYRWNGTTFLAPCPGDHQVDGKATDVDLEMDPLPPGSSVAPIPGPTFFVVPVPFP